MSQIVHIPTKSGAFLVCVAHERPYRVYPLYHGPSLAPNCPACSAPSNKAEQNRQVVVFVRVNNLTKYTVEKQETFTVDSHGPADLDTVIVGALREAAAQIDAR